ncbi:sorting nexin-24-like [Cotesia glomerata]|uniref:PX domain-containing protein n=1 Tax=Cotesia glomerata TaxID=32391 RepID=A0AAV7I1R8_COTGL|nr:sorting nexin-24-like [Cotesia glomerata]KAH0545684.1 hypothetical protein KQX54_002352 [Cotesia glomerata]
MYHVFISGYRLVEADHGKSFYVYTIEVTDTNTTAKYTIERRYSAFNALHRRLKKINDTVAFPPKRVRNSQPKVLEQRRSGLEHYITKMLQLSETKQQVLEFLGIESSKNSNARTNSRRPEVKKDSNGIESRSAIGHHPVITFAYDPYVNPDNNSSLPNIVIQGVLDGIYNP